jgi:MerR family transcriptional regulator, light-induced transcriptional regulator
VSTTRSNLLTTRELATAIGVSESSVKRWADDGTLRASRTAGGHRRIAVADAVRFIRRSGATVVRPHLLGLSTTGREDLEPGDDGGDTLCRWLRQGDAARVSGFLQALYLDDADVAHLLDGPVRQALELLGEVCDGDGIFREHRATDLVLQALRELVPLLPKPADDALVALGGAVRDDPHLVPTLGVSLVLAEAGYRAVNLGPNTPASALVAGARDLSARLVWVSVSSAPAKGLARYWRELLDGLPGDTVVAAGGRELRDHERIDDRRLVALDTLGELAAFLEGLEAR